MVNKDYPRLFEICCKSTYCIQLFNLISLCLAERWILRGRLLPGSAGEHHRVRALHAGDATPGWLFGDVGPTVVSMGQIRQHGALCLSEYADSGVRLRRTDHVRLYFLFTATRNFSIIKILRTIYKNNFTFFFLTKNKVLC